MYRAPPPFELDLWRQQALSQELSCRAAHHAPAVLTVEGVLKGNIDVSYHFSNACVRVVDADIVGPVLNQSSCAARSQVRIGRRPGGCQAFVRILLDQCKSWTVSLPAFLRGSRCPLRDDSIIFSYAQLTQGLSYREQSRGSQNADEYGYSIRLSLCFHHVCILNDALGFDSAVLKVFAYWL